jgi:hypothetical protein
MSIMNMLGCPQIDRRAIGGAAATLALVTEWNVNWPEMVRRYLLVKVYPVMYENSAGEMVKFFLKASTQQKTNVHYLPEWRDAARTHIQAISSSTTDKVRLFIHSIIPLDHFYHSIIPWTSR